MKLQKFTATLCTAALVASSSAFAQISANPFGSTPQKVAAAAQAPLNKQQALAALPSFAAAKVDARFLDRLMNMESNDVIVEFIDNAPPLTVSNANYESRLSAKKQAHKQTKASALSAFAPDAVEVLRDMDALPMAFVRVKSRSALNQMLSHSNVKGVYENREYSAQLAESLPLVQQPNATAAGKDGTGTTVVVIDTGVNYTRSEFGSCTAPGVPSTCKVVAAFDTAPDDGSLDNNGHGTNVAAIILGAAPKTKIAAIDAEDSNGRFFDAAMLPGINWAINNKSKYNIVALNMSIGSEGTTNSECPNYNAMTTPFANARAAGIAPVVAAGNNGNPNGVTYPACTPGAVRVGAVYDANVGVAPSLNAAYTLPNGTCSDSTTAADKVTCFSNGGSLITVFAPGAHITAGGYMMDGTSQAAPHVAGAIAALRAPNMAPNESVDSTVARLVNNGKMIVDSRSGMSKPRLNVYASLNGMLYDTAVQQMYLSFFGRPAEPAGLNNAINALRSANAPKTIVELNGAYTTNAGVKSFFDAFANSAEFNALHTGSLQTFVNTVYRFLIGRDVDSSVQTYWANQISSGAKTKAKVILEIITSILTNTNPTLQFDITCVVKKTAVSSNFTAAVDTPTEISAYSGYTATAKARQMLSYVSSTTDVNVFQPTVESTLASIVSGQ